MKNTRNIIIGTFILLSCLMMFTFADDITKVVQAYESNARVIYNGKEVMLGVKPFSIENSNYLPVRAAAVLFNKDIEWNQAEQKIIVSDKPDIALESLKTELASKNKNALELQDKIKSLEEEISGSKGVGIQELQDSINEEYGEYEGLVYRVILSGNEDEIRVKLEVDLSKEKTSWSKLNVNEKKVLLKQICDSIACEYDKVKIKGYIKDISESTKLLSFYNTYDGEIEIGSYKNYSTISTLEDDINNAHGDYFNDMHLTFGLGGNENCMQFTIYVQGDLFEEEWEDIRDDTLKNFMKKLCSEISAAYKECHIIGSVFDTDNYTELAICEMTSDDDFKFGRME